MAWRSLLLLVTALLFRKMEWPFGQWIWLVAAMSSLWDLGRGIQSGHLHLRTIRFIGLFIGLAALYLRYGTLAGPGRTYACIGLMSLGIAGFPIVHQPDNLRRITWFCCLLLLLTGSVLGDWRFYHVFRNKNLEEVLLYRAPDDRSNSVDRMIERLIPVGEHDTMAGTEALQQAHAFERERKWTSALEAYDLAIYENPYAAEAYLRRGAVKLLHLDIDNEQAESALRDLSRSIRLDSTMAEAWYLRAQALAYLDRKERVCGDALMAYRLDTAYRSASSEFIQKFCPESGHLIPGMPLHP